MSYLTDQLAVVVVLWLAVVALCARATATLLARSIGVRRTLVFWSLAPQLLLLGGKNFDALAVLTLVLASVALAQGRAISAGAAVGIGAATKLFPLVAVPSYAVALWRNARRRTAVLFVGASIVVLAIIDLPAIIAPYSLLQTAVWPYGVPTWNVDSIWLPVAILLDPFMPSPAADAAISAISLLGLAISYGVLVLRPALRRGGEADRLAWLAVALLVFWTRLRSTQYAIWLLPAFALYVPDVRLLLFMFVGDAAAYVGVFGLRGAPRDVFSTDALPFFAAILFGVLVRQIAVARLIAAMVARR